MAGARDASAGTGKVELCASDRVGAVFNISNINNVMCGPISREWQVIDSVMILILEFFCFMLRHIQRL